MRYSALLFDLDGTLIDTSEDIAYALNTALESAGGERLSTKRCMAHVGTGLANALKGVLQEREINYTKEEFQNYFELLRSTYHTHPHPYSQPYEGIRELLYKAHSVGITLGVLSNKADELVQIIVNHFFADIPFLMIRGDHTDWAKKPNPSSALEFIARGNFRADETLFIGDSEVDCKTADAANMNKAIVSWGFRDKKSLIESGCSPLYDSVEELEREIFG